MRTSILCELDWGKRSEQIGKATDKSGHVRNVTVPLRLSSSELSAYAPSRGQESGRVFTIYPCQCRGPSKNENHWFKVMKWIWLSFNAVSARRLVPARFWTGDQEVVSSSLTPRPATLGPTYDRPGDTQASVLPYGEPLVEGGWTVRAIDASYP